MDKKNNPAKFVILEYTWLVMFATCLGLGIYTVATRQGNFNYMFFVFSVLSLLLYFMRRHMRKNNMYNSKK